MPVIRLEVPAGTPADTQETIRIAVKAAVLKTLAPKQTKYDYVAVREVVAEIGDGVPLVEIDLPRISRSCSRQRGSAGTSPVVRLRSRSAGTRSAHRGWA